MTKQKSDFCKVNTILHKQDYELFRVLRQYTCIEKCKTCFVHGICRKQIVLSRFLNRLNKFFSITSKYFRGK